MRRVIKLGGSLLDDAHVRSALRNWLTAQPAARNVLIVGGGEWVEAIRRMDTRCKIAEEEAHWLCIRAMSVTARLAAALWPEFVLATRWSEVAQAAQTGDGVIIFDAEDFLRHGEPHLPGAALPWNWTVTSDAIAARVAEALAADELTLLKSSLPDGGSISFEEAASRGYVDAFFPFAARAVPVVRSVNLRAANFDETRLTA